VKISSCILCKRTALSELKASSGKQYFLCADCGLVFLSPELRLDARAEKERYLLHKNYSIDQGYRNFLGKALDPLCEYLREGMSGLDYGCGPGPTTSVILAERGYEVTNYDPFFADIQIPAETKFDFLTCTEVAEHFYNPSQEFQNLNRLVRTGGFVAIMTEILENTAAFESWWYTKDPTHVCFYQPKTMQFIGEQFFWKLLYKKQNVYLFQA